MDQFISWGEEVTWGTIAARSQHARCYPGATFAHEIPQTPTTLLGMRAPSKPIIGSGRGVASFDIPLVYDGNGILLKHCFGSVVDAGAPSTYTHTHTIDSNPYARTASPLVGLSVEGHYALPDSSLESMILHGGRVRSFGMSFAVQQDLKLSVDLYGQKVLQLAKTASPSFPAYASAAASPLIIPIQAVFTVGGSATNIYSCDFNCQHALEDDMQELGGTYVAAGGVAGKSSVTGTIERQWLAKTEYDKFIAGTTSSLLITCTGTGVDIFTVRLNNIFYNNAAASMSEGDSTTESLPFTAYEDTTYGMIQAVETNATATT